MEFVKIKNIGRHIVQRASHSDVLINIFCTDYFIQRFVPVMVLLSLSPSSTHGFGSLPSAAQSRDSWLEIMFDEDQNSVCSRLYLSQKDEAFKPETLRMLLHSVWEAEENMNK